MGSVAGGVVAVGIFAVGVVGVPGGWWPHQKVRVVVVVCGLTVASLSLPVVFCSDPRFPSVLVVWSLGVLGFCAALEVLVLLGVVLGLVCDESHEGVISGEVLGLSVRVATGRQVASVNRRGCLVSRKVCPSSHLRIPNGLAVGVVLGSGAG